MWAEHSFKFHLQKKLALLFACTLQKGRQHLAKHQPEAPIDTSSESDGWRQLWWVMGIQNHDGSGLHWSSSNVLWNLKEDWKSNGVILLGIGGELEAADLPHHTMVVASLIILCIWFELRTKNFGGKMQWTPNSKKLCLAVDHCLSMPKLSLGLTLTQHVPELVYLPYHIIFQHVIEEHTLCIRSSAVLAPGSTKSWDTGEGKCFLDFDWV